MVWRTKEKQRERSNRIGARSIRSSSQLGSAWVSGRSEGPEHRLLAIQPLLLQQGSGGATIQKPAVYALFVRLDVADLAAVGAFPLSAAGGGLSGGLVGAGDAVCRGCYDVLWRGASCGTLAGFLTMKASVAVLF